MLSVAIKPKTDHSLNNVKTVAVDWLPGDHVSVGDGEIDGIVLQVCFAGSLTTYEVAWWNGNARNVAWFHMFETSKRID